MTNNLLPQSRVHSRSEARLMITIGLATVVLYKLWKYALRQIFHFDPSLNYSDYQTFATYFRALGWIVGLFVVARTYREPIKELKIGRRGLAAVSFLGILPLYILFRSHFFDWSLAPTESLGRTTGLLDRSTSIFRSAAPCST